MCIPYVWLHGITHLQITTQGDQDPTPWQQAPDGDASRLGDRVACRRASDHTVIGESLFRQLCKEEGLSYDLLAACAKHVRHKPLGPTEKLTSKAAGVTRHSCELWALPKERRP